MPLYYDTIQIKELACQTPPQNKEAINSYPTVCMPRGKHQFLVVTELVTLVYIVMLQQAQKRVSFD